MEEIKLPPAIVLEQYESLLKIKPKELQTNYPFSTMSEEKVTETMKQIELVYQHLSPDNSRHILQNSKKKKKHKFKKGGFSRSQILVFTL